VNFIKLKDQTMSPTSRQRRDPVRSVRHRIKRQQLFLKQQHLEAQIITSEEFERDRQRARITLECYGWIPLTDQFYCRNLGLNDHRLGRTGDLRRDEMPAVIRSGGNE